MPDVCALGLSPNFAGRLRTDPQLVDPATVERMGVAVGITQPLRAARNAPCVIPGTLIDWSLRSAEPFNLAGEGGSGRQPAAGARRQGGSPSLRTSMFSIILRSALHNFVVLAV